MSEIAGKTWNSRGLSVEFTEIPEYRCTPILREGSSETSINYYRSTQHQNWEYVLETITILYGWQKAGTLQSLNFDISIKSHISVISYLSQVQYKTDYKKPPSVLDYKAL